MTDHRDTPEVPRMSWNPLGVLDRYRTRRPNEGDVVAYDYRAWEVRHVSDADPTPEEPFRAGRGAYRITLRRIHGAPYERENSAGDVAFRVGAGATFGLFPRYKNARVPLCSCCGHPWPCVESDQQAQAEREMKRAEKALRLMPGCCPACEEPVTSRQRAITFGGPNVRNPLAEGPTYHLRRKCHHAAAAYEELWVTAEPGRRRSLLTLRCEGTVIVHHDGSAECFGAEGSDCPSIYAQHRCYCACYLQGHGCGRGCSVVGHPGTRMAGRPVDPREVSR